MVALTLTEAEASAIAVALTHELARRQGRNWDLVHAAYRKIGAAIRDATARTAQGLEPADIAAHREEDALWKADRTIT